MSGISSKLISLIGQRSINQWAREHGLAPQTVHEWIKNDRLPRESALKDLERKTGRPVAWWMNESDEHACLPESSSGAPLEERETDMEYIKYFEPHSSNDLNSNNFLLMQISRSTLDIASSANVDPRHLKTITVNTDSLSPSFKIGEQALVDTSCTRIHEDGVYAIQQGSALRIKRIKLRLDGQIEVRGEAADGFTPEIYTQEAAEKFIIIGKLLPYRFGKTDL